LFIKSLITRVIILNILLLTTGIGILSLVHVRREEHHLLSATRDSAELLLSTVEKSIFNSMRLGNSEDVQAILEMVGRNHRLSRVRIFHPDGTILKSAHPREIGTRVDNFDLALFANNRHQGIFRVDGEEVLGMVEPIVSDERCFLCHGPGRKVIGVLNLNLSLGDTTQRLRQSYQFFLVSTSIIVVLLSVGTSFVLVRLVKRPIRTMAARMAQVEAGDLSVRMGSSATDEMGSLMRSFDSMVVNLEKTSKELEQYHFGQMERADRLASVGEMATGIAHEIKNPLAGISGAISVFADDFAADDPRREIVREVLEQIGRLDKTATDLLYFGRPGQPEFNFVDLNSLVKKTLFFVSQHPEARNIHRIKDLTRDLPAVWADEKQIQQVLLNVIINAVQAMPDGGTLTVQTEAVEGAGMPSVRVVVMDTGKGISEPDLERIFVPFHTTKTQGTGLGLAICRRLMEQHGGTIKVSSRVGEGTTFMIELPVAQGQPANGNEEQRA
jgi:signal transduction histidine kinase